MEHTVIIAFYVSRLLSMRMPKSSSFSVRDILDLPRSQADSLTSPLPADSVTVATAAAAAVAAGHTPPPPPPPISTYHHHSAAAVAAGLRTFPPSGVPPPPLDVTSWPLISPLFNHHNCKCSHCAFNFFYYFRRKKDIHTYM